MSTHFTQDISPDVLEAARLLQALIDRAVRRAQAEQAVSAPDPSEKVTRDEAAQILGCKPRTIYEYVAQGKLKPVPAGPKGGKHLYLREEVEKLAKGEQ